MDFDAGVEERLRKKRGRRPEKSQSMVDKPAEASKASEATASWMQMEFSSNPNSKRVTK